MESYTLLYFHFFLLACFQGSVMFYRGISTSFPCMAVQCSTVWIHHILLPIHQPLHIWLVSIFYPSWIMNGALNICVQFLMWMYVFISFGDKTRHRISESYGNSVFNILEELANCFPKWPPFSIPINHVWSFHSSTSVPILDSFFFNFSLSDVCIVVSHCS